MPMKLLISRKQSNKQRLKIEPDLRLIIKYQIYL